MSLEKPLNPQFSSGPCPKRPGWNINSLAGSLTGRSHRSGPCKSQLKDLIGEITALLDLPDGFEVGIVPASDTGAFEMAMWNLMGPLPVDVLYWESFGGDWEVDIIDQLRIKDSNVISAPYGELPDLNAIRENTDICFTWNGTTAGVKVPDSEWIGERKEGLVFCDATSAIFAQSLDWKKLDVITFSWQKVMGGEASHGVLILSPKAIARLQSYTPPWPIPKIFRLKEKEKIKMGIFSGETINTPSMLCVFDALDALNWIKNIGGLQEVEKRSNENAAIVQEWLDKSEWAENIVKNEKIRSNTNICIRIKEENFNKLSQDEQRDFILQVTKYLEDENVAYDINGYPAAPPGIRIYTGATVEKCNLKRLLPWLDHSYYLFRKTIDG